jgi:hypothetical protein
MATRSPEVRQVRASKARLVQSYPADHPKIVAVNRRLAELRAESYVRKVLAENLPMATRRRLAAQLRNGAA